MCAVDDHRISRIMTRKVLESLGFGNVLEAENGDEVGFVDMHTAPTAPSSVLIRALSGRAVSPAKAAGSGVDGSMHAKAEWR